MGLPSESPVDTLHCHEQYFDPYMNGLASGTRDLYTPFLGPVRAPDTLLTAAWEWTQPLVPWTDGIHVQWSLSKRAMDTSDDDDEVPGRGPTGAQDLPVDPPMEFVDEVDNDEVVAQTTKKKRASTRRQFNFCSRKKGRLFESDCF